MKRFRIPATVLLLLFLPTASASAQVGIALTGGINRVSSPSGVLRYFYQDHQSVTRSYTGLTATIPLAGEWTYQPKMDGLGCRRPSKQTTSS